jgi:putative transposase
MRILSTNTDGQSEFQAWGETVRLVGTCTQKRVWGESRIPRHSVSLTAGVSIGYSN